MRKPKTLLNIYTLNTMNAKNEAQCEAHLNLHLAF